MKSKTSLTYRDHLELLTEKPQNSASDYGMYIKESNMLQSFAKLSSTVIFLLDFTSKTYPIMGDSANQVMGHPKAPF